jgi:hypothetical protein
MRKTKLILIAMLSVLALDTFAQSITSVVTPSTSDTLCNGSTVFTGADSLAVFVWMQQATTPIATFTSDSTTYNLCPGVYSVEVWNSMGDTMYYDTVITILSPGTHLDLVELTDGKKLIRTIDISGKEAPIVPNRTIFMVYSDGSIERKYIVE